MVASRRRRRVNGGASDDGDPGRPGRHGMEATIEAWTRWCDTLERTGTTVLREMLTADAIDVAEGLRHLERMRTRSRCSAPAEPRRRPSVPVARPRPSPQDGGDNPQGLYLSGPINGTDTFRLSGTRGSARWVSIIVGQAGAAAVRRRLFLPELEVAADGTFELLVAAGARTELAASTEAHHARSCASSSGPRRRRAHGLTGEPHRGGPAPRYPVNVDTVRRHRSGRRACSPHGAHDAGRAAGQGRRRSEHLRHRCRRPDLDQRRRARRERSDGPVAPRARRGARRAGRPRPSRAPTGTSRSATAGTSRSTTATVSRASPVDGARLEADGR